MRRRPVLSERQALPALPRPWTDDDMIHSAFTDAITRTQQPIVTGTSVLGLKYKDGVMLAADNLGTLLSLLAPTAGLSSSLVLQSVQAGQREPCLAVAASLVDAHAHTISMS